MQRMGTFPVVFCLALFLLCGATAKADEPFLSPLYYGEGDFVKNPATLGGFLFTGPGLALGLASGSVAYVAGLPFDKEKEFMDATVGAFVLGSMFGGSTIVGGPFYVMKKTFYDFPKWLIGPGNEIEGAEPDDAGSGCPQQ